MDSLEILTKALGETKASYFIKVCENTIKKLGQREKEILSAGLEMISGDVNLPLLREIVENSKNISSYLGISYFEEILSHVPVNSDASDVIYQIWMGFKKEARKIETSAFDARELYLNTLLENYFVPEELDKILSPKGIEKVEKFSDYVKLLKKEDSEFEKLELITGSIREFSLLETLDEDLEYMKKIEQAVDDYRSRIASKLENAGNYERKFSEIPKQIEIPDLSEFDRLIKKLQKWYLGALEILGEYHSGLFAITKEAYLVSMGIKFAINGAVHYNYVYQEVLRNNPSAEKSLKTIDDLKKHIAKNDNTQPRNKT